MRQMGGIKRERTLLSLYRRYSHAGGGVSSLMERLDIKIINGLIYTDIALWSVKHNNYNNVSVLIDTGAGTTMFSDAVIKRLGCITDDTTTNVRVAGGSLSDVLEITIPRIKLNSIVLTNVYAHSHVCLDEFYFDGILGMNILTRFNVGIDFDDGAISLFDRKGANTRIR
jgi:hypothetical protein